MSLLAGLDYYKLTMSQFAFDNHREAQVTFTLKNRNRKQRLLDRMSVAEVQAALGKFENGFTATELSYLQCWGVFSADYVVYLADNHLPTPIVTVKDDELSVEVTGPWPLVSLWETTVMATVNELYFASESGTLKTEGHRRLGEKILALRTDPTIKLSEFGTRRRFSRAWQETVTRRLQEELPENFVGTSNPSLAVKLSCPPIGTFAHELPMVFGALEEAAGGDPLSAHGEMLDRWFDTYGETLSIALTDTFGSDFFFATFGEERARKWKGLRHDSGDPLEFGERAIAFYEDFGIDPTTKVIVFSDGIDLETIQKIHARFHGRVQLMYGWGTGLTNDLGVKALNIVMKATAVNGVGTVKLSDDLGKHTGAEADVLRYQALKLAFV